MENPGRRAVKHLLLSVRASGRQSMSAGCPISSKGALRSPTFEGRLRSELFKTPLRKMMFNRRKAVHQVVHGLPEHKKAIAKECVANTQGN